MNAQLRPEPDNDEVKRTIAAQQAREISSLTLTLRALQPILTRADVTEICINRPREAFLETNSGWERVPLPFADFGWCYRLCKLVANATRQRITEEAPVLSAALPGGERIQLVLPPATTPGSVAITIRRPAGKVWSLDEMAAMGLFAQARRATVALDEVEQQLLALLAKGDYQEFMRIAVINRKNIVISGATGSGKTTFCKALIRSIPPYERLITIEDAPELVLDSHPNHVRLFYSKGDQGQARVTPRQLLESCLRMRPDRILLAELRSDEAFDYLRSANSGHPGSITSVHASSAELAFEQLTLLCKQSKSGGDLPREEIKALLYTLVDIVVQFAVIDHRRCVSEIWYDPARKRALAAGA